VTLTALLTALLAGCQPTSEGNVIGYLIAQQLGTLEAAISDGPTGALTGQVLHRGEPVPDASVIVADRGGRPHSARTNPDGRYLIDGIPPGQYVPAAVAPGFEESEPVGLFGIRHLVTVQAGETSEAPTLELRRHEVEPLPSPFPDAIELTLTDTYTASAVFPAGALANVQAFQFARNGAVVDTLRVYLAQELPGDARLPMLFLVYPGPVDNWQPVSVAFASQGYAVVAISPSGAWGLDIDQHTLDARIALELALTDELSPNIEQNQPVVALGGSFSSAILHRLLRDDADRIAAWVTVGGVANAFTGAADFLANRIEMPPQYRYLIPAMGRPHLYPVPFLRYSPVYTADQLPPTMIIHTDADRIITIDHAYELEEAVRRAGVPTEVFYYSDVSHYLQIDENMTEESEEMFWRVVEFAEQYGGER
jgi:acetyl esterase/lipase